MSAATASTGAAETRKLRTRRRDFGPTVAFPELVWVHFLRQQDVAVGRLYEGDAETRYRKFQRSFQAEHGEIVSAYWATSTASGVAITIRARPWVLPDTIRLHWATDWATRDLPDLTGILYRTEALAVRVSEVLRDTSKRIAMQLLFNVASGTLSFSETDSAHDETDRAAFVAKQTAELDKIERYFKNSAGRSGQILYLGGALLGVMPLLILAAVAALFGLLDAGRPAVRTASVCFAAGGVGALVSVMSRMNSGRVGIDWEFGKDTLRTLGSLRPFVGATFGLMTFFALKSGLVALDLGDGEKNFYFYTLFSFAAGFSERFAQDMLLGNTLRRFERKPEPEQAPPTEPPPDDVATQSTT